MLTEEIKALAEQWEDMAISIRQMLHRIPETQFQEFKTSGYIASVLDTLAIPYKRGFAGGTGICAEITGASSGKCVALRADMDALLITEDTDLPFKSEHEGVMHACGHDSHMAAALFTAYILNELRSHFSGTVKIFFQPAEEGDGGAEPMISEGVLEDPFVDVCIGGHVMSEYPVGKIVYKIGPFMASPDNFELDIYGVGGHGAYPEKAVNPIVAASKAIEAIVALTDRSIPRVVSVCTVNGGKSPNVIPEAVHISGTARTFTPQRREEVQRLIEDAVKEAVEPMGARYEYTFIPLYPALINDYNVTERFIHSASRIVGDENVMSTDSLSMAGDDFSYFAKERPSTYVHIGCRSEQANSIYPIHSPHFTVDERCIKLAAMCYAQFAVDFLEDD